MNHGRGVLVLSCLFFASLALTFAHEQPNERTKPDDVPDGRTIIQAESIRVIDGDTIECSVVMVAERGEPLYWNIQTDTRPITIRLLKQRVRLYGVDAWEIHDGGRGPAAKAGLKALLENASKINLEPKGKDHFGRLLAVVSVTKDGETIDVAKWIVRKGFGIEYKP